MKNYLMSGAAGAAMMLFGALSVEAHAEPATLPAASVVSTTGVVASAGSVIKIIIEAGKEVAKHKVIEEAIEKIKAWMKKPEAAKDSGQDPKVQVLLEMLVAERAKAKEAEAKAAALETQAKLEADKKVAALEAKVDALSAAKAAGPVKPEVKVVVVPQTVAAPVYKPTPAKVAEAAPKPELITPAVLREMPCWARKAFGEVIDCPGR